MPLKIRRLRCKIKVRMAGKPLTRGQAAEDSDTPTMQFLMPQSSLDVGTSSTEAQVQETHTMPSQAFDLQTVDVNTLSKRVYNLMLKEVRQHRDRLGNYLPD